MAVLASGTGFAFSPAQVELLTGLVLDGHQWLSRGATPDYGAIGRQVARPAQSAAYLRQVAGDLLQLPTGRESELQALCDHLDGRAGPPLCGNRHFWRSDLMAHHRPGYYASARMFSDRLVNTDRPHNGEAFKSHHIADGCTLVLRSGDEYRDLFPLWDWQKIPGTTVELAPELAGEVCRQGSRPFAGGVSDGRYGLAAFDFERDLLAAHKCWVFFDEGIACLGAGITCTSPHPVVTTLNQCALQGEVVVCIAGKTRILPPGTHLLENPEWIHHDRVAYFFPQPARVHLEIGPRTGSWQQISHSAPDEPLTRELFSLWLDHGAGPQQVSYAYWVIPDISLDTVSAPPWRVLSNHPQLQALRHEGLGLTGIAFYQTGRLDLPQGGSLAVDQPCLVLLREGQPTWTVSVSDPENRPLQVAVEIATRSGTPQLLRFDLPGGPEAGRSLSQTLKPPARG